MEAEEAIRRAGQDERISSLEGYFLCSCFACINSPDKEVNEWTLLYYNPSIQKVLDCFVNEQFVTPGEETPPIAEIEKADLSQVKISHNTALSIAKENFKGGTISVLITLHKNPLVWTINLISPAMIATTLDIDAESGKILRKEETSLVRKV